MILSKRLTKVVSLVTPGNVAADIGCDHGYAAISLVVDHGCPRAIACDIRSGPLDRARAHVRDAGLTDSIDLRLGDGLSRLVPGEAQSILICGMGGKLMEKILSEGYAAAQAAQELILSPQSDLEDFRRFLVYHHFNIESESMVEEDGKYYTIFRVSPNEDKLPWTDAGFCYGMRWDSESLSTLDAFLKKEDDKLEEICQKLRKTEASEDTRIQTQLFLLKQKRDYIQQTRYLYF